MRWWWTQENLQKVFDIKQTHLLQEPNEPFCKQLPGKTQLPQGTETQSPKPASSHQKPANSKNSSFPPISKKYSTMIPRVYGSIHTSKILIYQNLQQILPPPLREMWEILIDPFFEANPSAFPLKVNSQKPVGVQSLVSTRVNKAPQLRGDQWKKLKEN